MTRKESTKIECPECHEMVGSQGMGLHRLHKHGVRRKKEEPKEEITIPEPKIEKTMTNEINEIISDPEPTNEKIKEPDPITEVSKPDPVKDGDKTPIKGKSFLDEFLDDLFGSNEAPEPKTGSKKDEDWW